MQFPCLFFLLFHLPTFSLPTFSLLTFSLPLSLKDFSLFSFSIFSFKIHLAWKKFCHYFHDFIVEIGMSLSFRFLNYSSYHFLWIKLFTFFPLLWLFRSFFWTLHVVLIANLLSTFYKGLFIFFITKAHLLPKLKHIAFRLRIQVCHQCIWCQGFSKWWTFCNEKFS